MTQSEIALTGNFEGWEYVSLGIGIGLLLIAVLLFTLYRKGIRKDIFSYTVVAELGLSIFLAIIAVFRIWYFFQYRDDGTFNQMMVSVIFSSRRFVIYASYLNLAVAVALIVSNISLIRHEGFSFGNLYAIGIAFVLLATIANSYYTENHALELMVPNAVNNIWYALISYFTCLYVAVVNCALVAARHTPSYDKDYVLILGCKVREDGGLYPIIRGRVDKAIEFVQQQEKETGKKAVYLPTGGKGSDEQMSEADAMKKYLIEHGVPEDRILAETKSTTTRENLIFSRVLINDPDAKAAFATTNFHVFRSGMLAKKTGWTLEGMGSETKWYFWPNAFMREMLGLVGSGWKGQLIVIAVVSAIAGWVTVYI